MRIALVHSYYRSGAPSGENLAVDAQAAALRRAGHEVVVIYRHSDREVRARLHPVRSAFAVATGLGADPTAELLDVAPDVVHVHNLFPNFGTRWLRDWSGPVIATLHNFRPVCAAGTLYRADAVCTSCPDGASWAAVSHRCYRGSMLATLPLAWRNRGGAAGDAVLTRADALVTISQRARQAYIAAGVDAERLAVVPNFVESQPSPVDGPTPADAWLLASRLAPEKGVVELLEEWPKDIRLDVFGDGPLRPDVERASRGAVKYHGEIANSELRARMSGYRGLVFPSRWFEAGPPLIYLEALAAGIPCLALAGSGAADDIVENGTGVVVPLDARSGAVRAALDSVERAGSSLRQQCRESFADRFSESRWVQQIEELYRSTLQGGRKSVDAGPG